MNTRLYNFVACLALIVLAGSFVTTVAASPSGTQSAAPQFIPDQYKYVEPPKLPVGATLKLVAPPVKRTTPRTTSSVASTFTVTNIGDAGAGSLRQAIIDANANAGADIIEFAIPVFSPAPHVITPLSGLPAITDEVFIDGRSQPGFSSTPKIQIDGSSAPTISGLVFQASDCVVRGLSITRCNVGIVINGSGTRNVWVYGNHIGVDPAGTADLGNSSLGIWVASGANNQIIGSNGDGVNDATEGNVISGTDFGSGIQLAGDSNSVAGNFIGTNLTGTAAIANGYAGIYIESSAYNRIGGTLPLQRNVISGNGYSGIIFSGNGNEILGNYIGTNAAGTGAIPNSYTGSLAGGIVTFGSATNTIIGGSVSGARNIISGNADDGIGIWDGSTTNTVIKGNYVGVQADGVSALGNGGGGVTVRNYSSGITVGGLAAGEGNVIANNGTWAGVVAFSGSGLTVNGNSIHNNTNYGIWVGYLDGSIVKGNTVRSNTESGILLAGATTTTVGGSTPAERNVVSANGQYGILLSGGPTSGNTVKGNYIGVNAAGTSADANYSVGLYLASSPYNIIGGDLSGEGNLVSGNPAEGILIEGAGATNNILSGNKIGTDVTGTSAIGNNAGVVILDAPDNTIGGTSGTAGNLISGNNGDGIRISGNTATGNIISGNTIGVNATGGDNLSNSGDGIHINNGASNTTIGGIVPGARNVISGNYNGVEFENGGIVVSVVRGNYIGVNPAGIAAMPNTNTGVAIINSPNITVGGTSPDARNIISGNGNQGVYIYNESSSTNHIEGNYIGTDVSGAFPIPNATGVDIDYYSESNYVGGATPGAGNLISGNSDHGVGLLATTGNNRVQGNFIGTNASATAALPNGSSGVLVFNSNGNTVGGTTADARNIISGNDVYGIRIEGSSSYENFVQGNYIGTDASGNFAIANFNALFIYNAPSNYIGGMLPGSGNLISGNGFGLAVSGNGATGNLVQGNLIGTNASGSAALGNIDAGVAVNFAPGTIIGGGSSSARNIISGNIGDGIAIAGYGSLGTVILNNYIGTQLNGIDPLPNTGNGIFFTGDFEGSPSNNIVGSDDDGENIIAFNGATGISVAAGIENTISGNSIFQNTGIGIDLRNDGVTPNDAGDGDGGANNRLNFPELDFAASDLQGIAGSIHSDPSKTFKVEFFRSASVDPSGYGEGQTYIGSTLVSTDGSGDGTFFVTFPGQLTPNEFITATSTDPDGNTSEFSNSVIIAPKVKAYGDHYVVNTTLSGVPLHWPDGKTRFTISPSIPTPFSGAIGNGFAAWDALSQLTYTNGGLTNTNIWGGNPDSVNNMVWITNNWTGTTGADSNVIAVTRVRYNTLNGELTDADIAFDAQHFAWDTSNDTNSANMNVQNVTTHEAGHFSGLGDIYNPNQPGYVSFMGSGNSEVTMFGYIRNGEVKKNSLDAPDTAGIQYIYDHIPQAKMDLVLLFDGSATFAATLNGFTPSKNASTELVKKMRSGDRIGVVRLPNVNALPLMTITDQASRNAAIAAISGLIAGGQSAIGSGLQAAESMLDGAAPLATNGKAMILFSAGEENALPSALSSLGPVVAAGTKVFTLGFQGSSGQVLSDSIASKTGGAYYVAKDTTIGTIVDQIWNRLTGQQSIADTVVASNNIPGFPQPGIRWQGIVAEAIASIEPGIRWQGSNFLLTLRTPDNTIIDSVLAAANPSDGIEYVSGNTFSYYRIKNPKPGTWTLVVQGRVFPPSPEPVDLYLNAFTDITMAVAFNQGIYIPGEPIEVSATLSSGGTSLGDSHVVGGNAITDATVIANILAPNGGASQQVTLLHTSNGVYKGTLLNTNKSGSYKFNFQASKTNEFNRQSTQSVFVLAPFTAPPSMIVNADPGQCSAIVTYAVTFGNPSDFPGVSVVCTPPSGSTFPLGTTTVTCIGTDLLGHMDTSKFTITVKDNQPPTISGVSASPNALTTPNKKMVTVTINYLSSDNCGPVTCSLSVTSNEPERRKHDNDCDDDDTTPDWKIIDAHHVQLRAEKSHKRKNRIYTITITCSDASGNKTITQVTVEVKKKDKDIPGMVDDGRPTGDEKPREFELSQNYPNPFNPTTQIEYGLPVQSKVTLKIYNTLGQTLQTLVDEIQDAGYQTADFDAGKFASGIYFYRLEAVGTADPTKSFQQVRKMLLMK